MDSVRLALLAFVASMMAIALVTGILVIRGSIRKGRWGANLNPVNCPRCNQLMPTLRKPKSVSQAMWGGWTCEQCGCAMDKWGREIKPS
jgi:hypothetical protein